MAGLSESIYKWQKAVSKYEAGDADEALLLLQQNEEQSAKIGFNISTILLKLGKYEDAIKALDETVCKDPHFAAGFFQRGVAFYKCGRYNEAKVDFRESHRCLHGNPVISYRQLGLPCELYECEILLNLALARSKTGHRKEAQDDLIQAQFSTVSGNHHNLVLNALFALKRGEDYPLYELPATCIFSPPKSKTINLGKKNFLGQAHVISSVKEDDSFVGFVGAKKERPALLFGDQMASAEGAIANGVVLRQHKCVRDRHLRSRTVGSWCLIDMDEAQRRSFCRLLKPGLSTASLCDRQLKQEDYGQPGPLLKTKSSPDLSEALCEFGLRSKPPNRKLPPPPTPPKLVRQPKENAIDDRKSNCAIKPTPVPRATARSKPKPVILKLHLDHTRAIRLTERPLLADLENQICRKFQARPGSLTLWFKPGATEELTKLVEECDILSFWQLAPKRKQHLTLWCTVK